MWCSCRCCHHHVCVYTRVDSWGVVALLCGVVVIVTYPLCVVITVFVSILTDSRTNQTATATTPYPKGNNDHTHSHTNKMATATTHTVTRAYDNGYTH